MSRTELVVSSETYSGLPLALYLAVRQIWEGVPPVEYAGDTVHAREWVENFRGTSVAIASRYVYVSEYEDKIPEFILYAQDLLVIVRRIGDKLSRMEVYAESASQPIIDALYEVLHNQRLHNNYPPLNTLRGYSISELLEAE